MVQPEMLLSPDDCRIVVGHQSVAGGQAVLGDMESGAEPGDHILSHSLGGHVPYIALNRIFANSGL